MKLSQLIAEYGDADVKFQALDSCVIDMQYSAKNGTKITFGTDARLLPSGIEEMGIVVWFDRKKVADILEKEKP